MTKILHENSREFVHLHVHTAYSLLDGSCKIKNLIARTKELGMKSIAITDHGNMFGCVDFFKEAKKQGIKPIIGCEVYVVPKSMHIKTNDPQNQSYHLVLLVKDETGYENLMKIVSKASIDGFYYRPRVDIDMLRECSEGLIAASACIGGEVPQAILKGDLEGAKQIAQKYKDIYKDDFYLEIQYHSMPEEQKANEELIKISKELDIPVICTNDVHYINKEDATSHDTLLCIQTGKTVDDPQRMKFPSDDFYLKSPQEMEDLFSHIPESLDNTVKIAEKCNFEYEFHVSKLPTYPLPEGKEALGYLNELCYEGLHRLYDNVDDELKDRLDYEIDVINTMGYVDYFLIVWDFVKFAIDNDIMAGPGRGSAAGSLVAYTLGITKIDPIKYGLIFERFLNPERVSMPDIDSDFCYERRQELIDYVVEKYGENNVSQIITFGTMAPKACIRDVGRALNYSYAEVDRIAKMVPAVLNITIEKALEMNPELQELYDDDERVRELIDISKSLEGLPRHTSTHAAGVVIASQSLMSYVPLLKADNSIVAQFDMNTLEELGLLKMDFLGLRTLTVIRDTIDIVKETKGINIDIDTIDMDDLNVYNMIGEGKTAGVFQLESAGMTSFMKELKPSSLEDIIAGISLYRPGPMAEIPRYIKNKKNPERITYDIPQLSEILDVTYGVIIYQEQVMQIVRDLAGYSLGRSDLLRRAMSKKKHDVMEEERKNFIHGVTDEEGNIVVAGCLRNNIDEQAANKIYDSMMDFASYAFNKSHAAAYAVVAYQTAFLLRYHPTEYICAMLNSVMGNTDKVVFYSRLAENLGIQVIIPNINQSEYKFTVKDGAITYGLGAIKNLGKNAINNIVESRKAQGQFENFMDFCDKIDVSVVNKRSIESLIKCGAFDSLKIKRSQLLAVYERVLDGVQGDRKRNVAGQINLFSMVETGVEKEDIEYPDIKEFRKKHMYAMEKEVAGIYLSGHPVEEYKETLSRVTSHELIDLVGQQESIEDVESDYTNEETSIKDGTRVIVGGIITEVVRKFTKNNDEMAFARLEDVYAGIECVIFPKIFKKYKSIINEDEMVVIKGRINIQDDVVKLICEDMDVLENTSTSTIYIQVEEQKYVPSVGTTIRQVISEYKGNTPIRIFTKKERKAFLLSKDLWVDGSVDVLEWMRNKFGNENVRIK